MRPVVALAIFLLSVSMAAPEPEYGSAIAEPGNLVPGAHPASPAEGETAAPKADRASIVPPPTGRAGALSSPPAPAAPAATIVAPLAERPASTSGNPSPAAVDTTSPGAAAADQPRDVALTKLCHAMLLSAQHNDLPVPFFANLIWQESRLRDDAVSPKGALGIAQFMPKVAVASGLANPFDPLQALAASARLLHELRDQFGNLGFVAAAYNAGAKRVIEWLHRRRALPRETRGYVVQVTGRTVEEWRKTQTEDSALRFARRLPCRSLPAFAELEQQQAQQHEAQQPALQQEAATTPARHDPEPERTAMAVTRHGPRARLVRRSHDRVLGHRHPAERYRARARSAERHRERHESKAHIRRAARERHRRV